MLQRARTCAAWALLAAVVVAAVLATPVPAQGARNCAYFDFAKGTNINSTLTWKYVDGSGRCILSHSYRAGSGDNTDPCDPDHGWLPNGWNDLKSTYHQNGYNGSLIKGRVWHVDNKACQGDGTVRTELFIHTEETSSRGQTCTSNVDDPWCWDVTAASGAGAGTNDYHSQGCIKVRRDSPEETQGPSWPNDMKDVHNDWHDLGGGSGHGVARTDSPYVHS
jgi:hypothetical protein